MSLIRAAMDQHMVCWLWRKKALRAVLRRVKSLVNVMVVWQVVHSPNICPLRERSRSFLLTGHHPAVSMLEAAH